MGVVLNKTRDADKFYLHAVITESISAFKTGASRKAKQTGTEMPVISILQKIVDYK